MTQDYVYTNFARLERVDSENGIIYGVSVITIGEAQGHGLWVDETAINQILQLAKAKTDGVKVRAEHTGKIFDTSGKLTNFRRDGNCIRADFEILKSDENYSKILEMAQKLPKEFGLSVSTKAQSENTDGKKMVRFQELESVDLVGNPAANPNGLFSKSTTNNKSMIDKVQLCKFLKLDENASDEAIKTAFEAKCKMDAEGDAEAKKKLESKKKKEEMDGDGDGEGKKKDEKFDTLQANLLELSKKLETIELANKTSLESAKKTEVQSLIAEASKEGKVVPLTDVILCKMDIADVKLMLSNLPKGQLKLSKKTEDKKVEFKSNDERVQFCREQIQSGAALLTQEFAAAGLIKLN